MSADQIHPGALWPWLPDGSPNPKSQIRNMTKLRMYPFSINGNVIAPDQFGYTLRSRQGFNPEGVDTIQFWCRGGKNRICSVSLTLGPQVDADEHGMRRWHWDGNMEAPTVSPSIGCDAKCGWHGHINAGEVLP
jgi:hypothetical protein